MADPARITAIFCIFRVKKWRLQANEPQPTALRPYTFAAVTARSPEVDFILISVNCNAYYNHIFGSCIAITCRGDSIPRYGCYDVILALGCYYARR